MLTGCNPRHPWLLDRSEGNLPRSQNSHAHRTLMLTVRTFNPLRRGVIRHSWNHPLGERDSMLLDHCIESAEMRPTLAMIRLTSTTLFFYRCQSRRCNFFSFSMPLLVSVCAGGFDGTLRNTWQATCGFLRNMIENAK